MASISSFSLIEESRLRDLNNRFIDRLKSKLSEIISNASIKIGNLIHAFEAPSEIAENWGDDTSFGENEFVILLEFRGLKIKFFGENKDWWPLWGFTLQTKLSDEEKRVITELFLVDLVDQLLDQEYWNSDYVEKSLYQQYLTNSKELMNEDCYAWVYGRGWLYSELEINALNMQILIDSRMMLQQGLKPTISEHQLKLQSRSDAINSVAVEMKASLGDSKISLNDFQQLKVGDILKTDKSVSELIEVSTIHGKKISDGILGQKEGFVALQLIKD